MDKSGDKIAEKIISVFFPKFCLGCGIEGNFVCKNCLKKINSQELACPVCDKVNFVGAFCKAHQKSFAFSRLLFISYFDGLARKIVLGLKYEGLKELAKPMSKMMAKVLIENFRSRADLFLVPVPLFFAKRLSRGFNQSEILSKHIAQILGASYGNLVLRQKSTKSQVELSKEKRKQNMENAFILSGQGRKIDLRDKIIVIVDDVYTTGSTINEVAKILKKKKPSGILALTFCKD